MSAPLWDSKIPPSPAAPSRWGKARAVLRISLIIPLICVCMGLMLATRAVERFVKGARRPWSSVFPRIVSALALRIMGIDLTVHGTPMTHHGLVVANHSSWLDILVLNAVQKVFFVSKAEVANWPAVGAMAKAAGTVFITRDRAQAAEQKAIFENRLKLGHKLLFFPEGTSTDSLRVLPFKPTLFAALFDPQLRDECWVQPVTVRYIAPEGQDVRFYGWWGVMDFGASLMDVLKVAPQGRVEVTFHDPVEVASVKDRKELARRCEEAVRSGLPPVPVEFENV